MTLDEQIDRLGSQLENTKRLLAEIRFRKAGAIQRLQELKSCVDTDINTQEVVLS